MYLMQTLADANEDPANDERAGASLRELLDSFDFWFVPVVNPDGYAFTHSARRGNRLWRKNRSRRASSGGLFGLQSCVGADPNRNYDYHWMESGSSADQCDSTFAGATPNSELEVQLMSRLMLENSPRLFMYLTLHSFGQYILYPYGYARVDAHNHAELHAVALEGARHIEAVRGTKYEVGTPAKLIYSSAGGSDDFAHAKAGVRFVFTIELPDRGGRGFLSPASWILPVGRETLVGVDAMIRKAQELARS